MNRFGKILVGILLCLTLIHVLLDWHKYEMLTSNWRLIGETLFIPLLGGLLLNLFFRKREGKNKLYGLLNTIIVICIIRISFDIWLFHLGPLEYSYKNALEQLRIENAVKKWVSKNAYYPDSYHPLSFTCFQQVEKSNIASPEEWKSYDGFISRVTLSHPPIQPVGYYIKEHPKATFQYAYYFIKHKHIIKNKSGTIDTVQAYFQIDTAFQITDVRLVHYDDGSDKDISATINTWREKYGNGGRDLDLEIHGNDERTYYFKYFYEGRNDQESIVPYSNGRVNGVVYHLNENGDTTKIETYRSSVRNGVLMIFCSNKRLCFKANYINGKFYGLWTSWDWKGNKMEEGTMANDIKIGLWKYWDENGKLIKIKDLGNLQLLDSIPKNQ